MSNTVFTIGILLLVKTLQGHGIDPEMVLWFIGIGVSFDVIIFVKWCCYK